MLTSFSLKKIKHFINQFLLKLKLIWNEPNQFLLKNKKTILTIFPVHKMREIIVNTFFVEKDMTFLITSFHCNIN